MNLFQELRWHLRRYWELWGVLPESTSPNIRPQRTGWPPLPDVVQMRRRRTDARPWDNVRSGRR